MIVKKTLEPRENISDYAYTVLRQNILTLYLEPGRRLSETEIAVNLSISRTPVREAMIKLSKEGMLQVQPQRGTFVSKIDLSLVEEARFVRRTLEERVTSLAAACFMERDALICRDLLQQHKQIPADHYEEHFHFDELFHRAIYTAAGKERTWEMIDTLSWDYQRIRYLALIDLTKMGSIISEHEEILDALASHNEARALEAVRRHLDRWLEESISIESHHESYFKSAPPLRP